MWRNRNDVTVEMPDYKNYSAAMKHQLSIVLFACAVLAPCVVAAQAPAKKQQPLDAVGQIAATLEPTRTVVYKTIDNRKLQLHVFDPKDVAPGDKRACFLVIHGGGWTSGEPRRMYPFAAHLADRGLVAISLEYRLAKPKSNPTVFDCVKDGRSAVRYIRRHAEELAIDPEKIIVSGGSAGGHIALSTALFKGIDESGEDTAVSCIPNALVLLFPVVDTSPKGYGNAKIGDRWQELSPLLHVQANMPPTILFHSTGDTVSPFAGAKAFHEAMLKAGNRCEFVVHEGGRHGYLMFDRSLYMQTLDRLDAYLTSLGLLPPAK